MEKSDWREVLRNPDAHDHIVQVYQDPSFLAEAVGEYLSAGLRAGEAAIVIARPEHRALFEEALSAAGVDVAAALEAEQLRVLDAQQVLDTFMREGLPEWTAFHSVVGG